jgi:alanyl-tRNA synthetase
LETEAKVLALVVAGEQVERAYPGQEVAVILDRTTFYAESGGQTGDQGALSWSEGEVLVSDTQKISGVMFSQVGKISSGAISHGQVLTARVNLEARRAIERNHSATHLLHQALKEVLGTHVNQAGSLVKPGSLRFDFSHFSSVTQEELDRVEEIVNNQILATLAVQVVETSKEEAKAQGAAALFGEKYGDVVRMVSMGEFSKELCGGTHVRSTGEIGLFKISSEGGIGAGLRRIEAVTGYGAILSSKEESRIVSQISSLLRTNKTEALAKVEDLLVTLKEQEKELQGLQQKLARNEVSGLLDKVVESSGVKILAAKVQAPDMDALREMTDMLKDKLKSGVIVLGAAADGKVNFVAAVTKDLLGKLHAGNIVKEVAKVTGGGGGGRPDMAQAGGKDADKLDQALEKVAEIVNFSLK